MEDSVSVGVLYLRYEVQESVSWESSHRQAHKQLQDECICFLAGVEEDQADTKHGTQCDEQDGRRAVAVLCRQERLWSFSKDCMISSAPLLVVTSTLEKVHNHRVPFKFVCCKRKTK